MKKILVMQLRHSGDVLLTLPAVKLLRRGFPDATIDFLVDAPHDQALLGSPDIDNVVVYDRTSTFGMLAAARRGYYDCTIDYLGTPRTAILGAATGAALRAGYARVFHRWAYNKLYVVPPGSRYVAVEKMDLVSKLFGLPEGKIEFNVSLPEAARERAKAFLAPILDAGRPLITVAPGSQRHFNRWFPDRYAPVIDWLQDEFSAAVVLLWAPKEKPLVDEIASLCRLRPLVSPGTKGLTDVAAFLDLADLHIGADNGGKHVATAVGAATFTIYGPHDPVSWTHPDRSRHRYIKTDACLCEHDVRRKHACRELACLRAVTIPDVERAIRAFLPEILAKKPARRTT